MPASFPPRYPSGQISDWKHHANFQNDRDKRYDNSSDRYHLLWRRIVACPSLDSNGRSTMSDTRSNNPNRCAFLEKAQTPTTLGLPSARLRSQQRAERTVYGERCASVRGNRSTKAHNSKHLHRVEPW